MRYENLMDLNVVNPTTKMMRVVDRQGYHLRWIEVPVESEKTGPRERAGEGRVSKSDGG